MRRLATAITIVSISFLTFVSCRNAVDTPPRVEPPDPLWSNFVSAHTAGLVSRKAHIRIEFSEDVVAADRVGDAAGARGVLTLEPPVAGELSFTSPRELVLVPRDELEMGRYYHARLSARSLDELPDGLSDFEWVFQVIKQELEVELAGLTAEQSGASMRLSGAVLTADVADADRVENVVTARYGNGEGALPLTWRHSTDGRRHDFEIPGIARQASTTPLTIAWDGAPIDVATQGSEAVDIPARSEFKVTRVQTFQNEQTYIQVFFSDLLDPQQNLNGLVQLDQTGFTTRIQNNILTVYPALAVSGNVVLTLEPGIRNTDGTRLEARSAHTLAFASLRPQVRLAGNGVILPDNPVLSIPFEAVGVRSVNVSAFRIYEDNIGQFLQSNKLDGDNELSRVGRYLWRKKIHLSSPEPNKWNRYSLDVTDLFEENRDGMFRLSVSIRRSDSTYTCPDAPEPEEDPQPQSADDLDYRQESAWDYAETYWGISEDGSSWEDRDNPCKDAYYKYANDVRDARNFLASNIGLLAKRDQHGALFVTATNLGTSEPLRAAKLSVMNFQDQVVTTATTDANGFATLDPGTKPFYLLAEKDGDRGYLKLSDGTALPVSHFDVGGDVVRSGIKGYIYGERGVWRPGDDIHLTFVLEDEERTIPPGHPVAMELFNPKGQLIEATTNTAPVGDFYAFKLSTSEDALTGLWTANARLGGNVFSKLVKIETVMPNRLKVELDFQEEFLKRSDMPLEATLFGQWLSGAKASNLEAKIEARLFPVRTRFDRNTDFVFDDPARNFESEPQNVFEGALDGEGYAKLASELFLEQQAPGMLRASFTSRVFEPGGAFSISQTSLPFSPYDNYVGLKIPRGDARRNMLLTDVDHTVEIASLDADGNPVSLPNVDITLYKIDWKWWWDGSGDALAQYASARHHAAVETASVSTTNGAGAWTLQVKYPAWGRYLLRACDRDGGHCTGQVFYIDWPGWAGRAVEQSGPGANALTFFADKSEYQVGETAHVQLPEASQGRALLTLENGTGILEARWITLQGDSPLVDVPITRAMTPNVYVSLTLVQPHAGKDNDRPIRLYGITPLVVNDPATRLEPELTAPDEWEPQSEAKIRVAEASGRAMTYTVAVVDEGLLGLTNFKTPSLHDAFYKKEALGVVTWDLFDDVVGAYGGELERLLALGGDVANDVNDEDRERRRFPPVVTFLGPFELERGATNEHRLELPQYVGAVRVMVVAGRDGAYGSTDKSVFVRKPLMLLPTLPRVVSPGESLRVPVSVFVMDESIKNVRLEMATDERFQIQGPATTNVAFTDTGDELGFLSLRAGDTLGTSAIRFTATSGRHRAEASVNLEVRSPNPPSTRSLRELLEPGATFETRVEPHGLPGTNTVKLEMASIPPLDLERRLHYLVRYPHGCLEQTTSAVFPQLYLTTLLKLEPERAVEIDSNITAGIRRLRGFQVPNGGFVYWPGGFWSNGTFSAYNTWSSTYVGHFLLEAQRLGHHVPAEMLSGWVRFQKSAAQAWSEGNQGSSLQQAYRLYTLALAGEPELGAMNRLREQRNLSTVARWQLAAAYALAGLSEAANEIVAGDRGFVPENVAYDGTFASTLRDQAMVLNAMLALDRQAELKDVVDRVSADLSSERWHSTHATSFALLAMAKFAGSVDSTLPTFEYSEAAGAAHPITMEAPLFTTELTGVPDAGAVVRVRNTSSRRLFASVIVTGTPEAGEEQASSSGLAVEVRYTDADGGALNVGELGQGDDFVAHLTVRNTTSVALENLALSQLIASGWEIQNTRLTPEGESPPVPSSAVDHEDIRDDRVYRYFGLSSGETKNFTTRLTAAYLGRFYLPGVAVEAMYDGTKNATTRGQWVEVMER